MRYAAAFLSIAVAVSAVADESCFYPSKQDEGSYIGYNDCGLVDGDRIKLGKSHLKNMHYDKSGLACVLFSPDDAFYLHENGRSQRVPFFDNGCDYFERGLARGIVNEQMVFVDETLKVVLAPGFELISPFDYGHAVVCNGPFDEEKYGEHTMLKGGMCGLINEQGKLVVKAEHPIEARDIFQSYLNSHNHCPRPPVVSESAARCHAKHHVANMADHSPTWNSDSIARQGEVWIITFIEKDRTDELTLVLQADTAQWASLIPESHEEALQRVAAESAATGN